MYHTSGFKEKKVTWSYQYMKKKLSKNPRGLCPKSSEECKIEGIHLNVIKLNQK